MSEPLDIEKELEEGRKPGNQTFFKNDTNNRKQVSIKTSKWDNLVETLGYKTWTEFVR